MYIDRLRDEQLSALLDFAAQAEKEYCGSPADSVLVEMIRRGQPAFRDQITKWTAAFPVDETFKTRPGLEMLTALRRMEGKPDPLSVLAGPGRIECATNDLPEVKVTVRNTDVDREVVSLQIGCDYRCGKGARWRFEAHDLQGYLLPEKPPLVGDLDGSFIHKILQFGDSHETKLDMDQYSQPLSPGRYFVRVLYHNWATIADLEDISDSIVFSSEPFELIVKPTSGDSRPASQPQ